MRQLTDNISIEMNFTKYFSNFFVIRTTMIIVLVLFGFLGSTLYSHNGKIEASPSTCRTESAQAVLANNCSNPVAGGLCGSSFYKDITFSQPYAVAPNVLVTINHISVGPSCAGGATDKAVCYPADITTTGFRLYCSGSPVSDGCGPGTNGYRTMGSANWVATDADASCGSLSGHGIVPTSCANNQGGLCAMGSFSKEITFSTPFSSTPSVLVAAENVSNQSGCVGGATDQVLCFPSAISTAGFTLNCSGSPFASCGTSEGFKSLATAGWLAVKNTNQCKTQSQHALQTAECPSGIVSGVCASVFRKTVTFPEPFTTIPKVTITPELITDSSGVSACAQGATDAYFCEARDITKTGFTALCSGSPQGNECGSSYEGYSTSAKFGYVAVDSNCLPENVTPACASDSDCGTSGFTGSLTCQNNDVYQNYKTYVCNNPGTSGAQCANSTASTLKQKCAGAQGCNSGGCFPEVW